MDEVFNNQYFVEKLSKINSSQNYIQTLSSWCVSHRMKAKEIVDTWSQAFSGCHKEKAIPLIYLANDILQNSKHKGNEFVDEFWKVLPGCMRNVSENGEHDVKEIIIRVVEIWEERKVFGSHWKNLKDVLLGNAPTFSSDTGKNSELSRTTKKDAHSIKPIKNQKPDVGNMSKKRATPDQPVLDEHSNEDTALSKCKDSVQVLEKMEKDIGDAFVQGTPKGLALLEGLQEQENVVKRSIELLMLSKATTVKLVSHLRESLKEQETKLESMEKQLQIAQYQTEHAANTRELLVSSTATIRSMKGPESQSSHARELVTPIYVAQPQQHRTATPTASSSSSAEEDHKKAAHTIASKLLASTSAAQILTSVLADLAAGELAAPKSVGMSSQSLSDSQAILPCAKRPRLENPVPTMVATGKTVSGLTQHLKHAVPVSSAQTCSTSEQQLPQCSQVVASAVSTSSRPYGFVNGLHAATQPLPQPARARPLPPRPRPPQVWQQRQQQPGGTAVYPQGLGSTDSRRCFNGPATMKRNEGLMIRWSTQSD